MKTLWVLLLFLLVSPCDAFELSGIWYGSQFTYLYTNDKGVGLVPDRNVRGAWKAGPETPYRLLKDNVVEYRWKTGDIRLMEIKPYGGPEMLSGAQSASTKWRIADVGIPIPGVIISKDISSSPPKGIDPEKWKMVPHENEYWSQDAFIGLFTKWVWGIGTGTENKYCCEDDVQVKFYMKRTDTKQDYFTSGDMPDFEDKRFIQLYRQSRRGYEMVYETKNGIERMYWLPLSLNIIVVSRVVADRPTINLYSIRDLHLPKELQRPEFWTREHPKHWGYEGFRSGFFRLQGVTNKDCDVTYYIRGPAK